MIRRAWLALILAALSGRVAAQQVEISLPVAVAPTAHSIVPVVGAALAAPVAPALRPLPLPAAVPLLSAIAAFPVARALPISAAAAVPQVPLAVLVQAGAGVARAGGLASRVPRLRPLRLVIAGPPGSGKGTYAARISAEYGPVPISAGGLLRVYAKDHPDIAAIMNAGDLVPAGLVVSLVRDRLAQEDVRRRGFILDGFPRRQEEARALMQMLRETGTQLDGVLFLDVPEAELLRRILARNRGADDNETTFRERMRVYREETLPVYDYLRRVAPFLSPSVAAGDIDTAYGEVRRALDSLPR